MKTVIVESPYAGDIQKNWDYLAECLHDCLMRGEAPFASHGFYTNLLDDRVDEERALGIECGFAWGNLADTIAVYTDLGISKGMQQAIYYYQRQRKNIEYRKIRA